MDSDSAQDAALSALKRDGVAGGAVPAHRCLFCDTDVGRTALVRQLEPDVHVDAGAASVAELARFLPRVVHVTGASAPSSPGVPLKNVAVAATLAGVLLR